MSMANSVRIKYRGETLCCLDQTEVKAVEPYLFRKSPPQNILKRIMNWGKAFFAGVSPDKGNTDCEEWTKVSFKDGTWLKIKMPFLEFISAYC